MQLQNHDANNNEEEGPSDYYQVEIQPVPPMNDTPINYFDNDFVTKLFAQEIY